MHNLWQDIRYAFRQLRSHPGFALTAIVLASARISVGLGIVIGLVLSFGLSRFIAQWVENTRHNPLLVLAGSALLLAVAILACLAPARRASSVDPMTALRCE